METNAPTRLELLAGLEQLGLRMRRGRFIAALGWVATVMLGFFLLAGISDFLVGWERPVRLGITLSAGVLFALAVSLAWLRAMATPLAEVAQRADTRLGDRRQRLSLALDLSASDDSARTPLHRHLAGLALADAAHRLPEVNGADLLDKPERQLPWRRSLLVLLVIALAAALHPRAAGVVSGRLLQPWAELAPYSPWRFQFPDGDTAPRVIYGKDAELQVGIEGPRHSAPVELLLRSPDGNTVDRLPTFRDGNTHSRKIEGVTRPLQYAFTIGRARSEWRELEILYQPRLAQAAIEMNPPSYSRLAPSRFEIGGGDLRALRGTAVRLSVESNRPLSGGILEGRAQGGGEVLRRIDATQLAGAGAKQVEFDWQVEDELVWTLDLIDVQGARMKEPLLFVQQVIPDEKPDISMVEPGPFVFATPESELRLVWDVRDDLGLDRLDLVRAAGRFRERAAPVSEGAGEKQVRLERRVPLADLGVRPGQSLEYLVEARDRNPSLLGVAVSPATKVKIISEEEYAERLRIRTTLEEFANRYRALREVLDSVLRSLEDMASAGTADALEAARKQALAEHKEALGWFQAFAKDFPAFATDAMLNELSGGIVDELEANLAELDEEGSSDPAGAAELARRLAERLRPGADALIREGDKAEEISAIAAVMEMGAELEAVHREQGEISDRLGRLAREMALGITDNRSEVPALRERQLNTRERLARIESELPARLEALPESASGFRKNATRVLEQLEALEVGGQMGSSVNQAGEGKVPGAAEASALALANLDQILGTEDNDFTRICKGGEPGFCSGEGVAATTLAQMLAALRARAGGAGKGGTQPGSGSGQDAGMAFGATGGSGYSMQGIQMNIPLLGPARLDLSRPPAGGATALPQELRGGGSAVENTATDSATLPRGETSKAGGRGWSPDQIPLRYRGAVSRFFSESSLSETSDPSRP